MSLLFKLIFIQLSVDQWISCSIVWCVLLWQFFNEFRCGGVISKLVRCIHDVLRSFIRTVKVKGPNHDPCGIWLRWETATGRHDCWSQLFVVCCWNRNASTVNYSIESKRCRLFKYSCMVNVNTKPLKSAREEILLLVFDPQLRTSVPTFGLPHKFLSCWTIETNCIRWHKQRGREVGYILLYTMITFICPLV